MGQLPTPVETSEMQQTAYIAMNMWYLCSFATDSANKYTRYSILYVCFKPNLVSKFNI